MHHAHAADVWGSGNPSTRGTIGVDYYGENEQDTLCEILGMDRDRWFISRVTGRPGGDDTFVHAVDLKELGISQRELRDYIDANGPVMTRTIKTGVPFDAVLHRNKAKAVRVHLDLANPDFFKDSDSEHDPVSIHEV